MSGTGVKGCMFKSKEVAQAYFKRRREEKQSFLRNLRAVPCKDCGGSYPWYVMEFDHVPERGKKVFSPCDGGCRSISKKLLDELEKCDVICSNCHSIRTHIRRYGKIE